MRRVLVSAVLAFAFPAHAVTIDWVTVGDPGNAPDTASNCLGSPADCGSVNHSYLISKYETTNAQYAEFLNAVDPGGINARGLYNTNMNSDSKSGGISFVSGNASGTKYVVKPSFGDKPVTYVSFYDALRFANWLNNGQNANTESGAYTITTDGIRNNTITRNDTAKIFLTSQNEWYKAAYYSPSGVYFDFPAGTDTPMTCTLTTATPNSANCGLTPGPTDVGSYTDSASPYGTFDQGGNVDEWNEQIATNAAGMVRGLRGGNYAEGGNSRLSVSDPNIFTTPADEHNFVGFRVTTLGLPVPEPGTCLLVMTGLLGLAVRRKT